MKPTVYLIGVGPLSIGALETARALGLDVIGTDRNPDAPGFAHCDEHFVLDGADDEGHAALAETLAARRNIVGVYCGGEFGLHSARRVAEACGLPANDQAALDSALDKRAMKDLWLAAGVPTPHGRTVESADELAELLARADGGERWVLKPTAGSGSRGVHVVSADCDPAAALAKCLDAVDGEGTVLIEPFLEGRSIDANGLLVQGRFIGCGVLEKFITPLPDRLPIGGCEATDLSAEEVSEVYALLELGARALGLVEGPLKADLIRTAEGFKLLEVAPRFHGDVTTQNVLPFGSGLDPLAFLMQTWTDSSVGADAMLRPRTKEGGHALWRVICLPPGEVLAWPDALDADLRARHPNITQVWHNPRCRKQIGRYTDTTSIPGYVSAFGRTRREAEEAMERWFGGVTYDVQPDSGAAAWYAALGRELDALGFSRASSGWGKNARAAA